MLSMSSKHQSKEKTTVGPSSASAYRDPHYWDERFADEEHYEWLKDYSHFRHLIQAHVPSGASVLELGCGNSRLSEELYSDGVTDITCTDLSVVAVERMQERLSNKGYKEIKVLQADMLDLPFSNESFNVVIEKGTMDVLFVDSGDPWNPRPEAATKVMSMLENVHRVLKPDGIFISISFGQPHFRSRFFNAPNFTWSLEWISFGGEFYYFFYISRKGKRSLNIEEPCEIQEKPKINLLHEELESEDYIFRMNIDA